MELTNREVHARCPECGYRMVVRSTHGPPSASPGPGEYPTLGAAAGRRVGEVNTLFARRVARDLAGLLEVDEVRVDPRESGEVRFDALLQALPVPTYCVDVHVESHEERMLLQWDQSFVVPAVARMSGTYGGSEAFSRELSGMEGALAERLTDTVLRALEASWSECASLELAVGGTESMPSLLTHLLPLDAPVLCVVMEVRAGDARGALRLACSVALARRLLGLS